MTALESRIHRWRECEARGKISFEVQVAIDAETTTFRQTIREKAEHFGEPVPSNL